MDTFAELKMSIPVLLLLLFVLIAVIKYSRQIYIILYCLPRDLRCVYIYVKFMMFTKSCVRTNQTASSMFDKTVKKFPDKACFLYQDDVWTYKRVQDFNLKIAKYFQQQGYQKGDVVGLFMENRPEYVAIWLGLGRIGVVTSFLNYHLRLGALEHCINVSNCKGIIYGEELDEAIRNLRESPVDTRALSKLKFYSLKDGERKLQNNLLTLGTINLSEEMSHITPDANFPFPNVNNSDAAFLVFTSGTTGLPKASKLTYARFFTMAGVPFPTRMSASRGHILYTPIPLYHAQGGFLGVNCAIIHGITQVIVRKFSARNFWKDCIKYEVTHCQYLGEIIRYLQAQPPSPEDRKHKVISFFGNGLNASLWKSFTERFNIPTMVETYGSTEGNCNTANADGIMGVTCYLPVWLYPILPIFLAKIDPRTGQFLRGGNGLLQHAGFNEVGILLGKIVKGNPLREFEGYTDPLATTAKVINSVKKKGDAWFNSGDTFTMDEFGHLYFKDRLGDTFRWKGENVSTTEVEKVIGKITNYHHGVSVYGVKIPGMEGKCGMATISDPDYELSLESFGAEMKRQLPPYAVPVFLRVARSELIVNGTFKLEKVQLQKQGFDIHTVKDELFILKDEKNYVKMTGLEYTNVINGRMRV